MPCHSANGFIARATANTNGSYAVTPVTNVAFASISCQTCHEPHGLTVPADNPHLIRSLGAVTMPDGTVITNAGFGAICLQCHQVRNGSVTNMLVKYPIGQPTWFGGSSFGVHDNPQGDMVEGLNAVTYGQNIPSAAHRTAVTNLCVGCHMQTLSLSDPGLYLAGGHTWNMSYSVVTNGVTNTVDKVDVCVQCHGQIASFDMPRGDLNGDGVIEGAQTEVQHLLDKLSTMLPNSTYQSNANYVADGLVKTSVSFKTNWPAKFLKAGYNWQFVNNDGSLGVHNLPFAVGILKASIADLTGDSNNDGLADAWQIQYFGSPNNPQAAPNYVMFPSTGMPNWLMYSLGLNPLIPGQQVTGGVVWADGKGVGNPAGTNTVQIYTAAEVVFDTQPGTSYYIQEVTSLSGGWQTLNPNTPILGTGNSVSYVTPTRNNVQQYFRVYHNP
jgi:cytochrome c553